MIGASLRAVYGKEAIKTQELKCTNFTVVMLTFSGYRIDVLLLLPGCHIHVSPAHELTCICT